MCNGVYLKAGDLSLSPLEVTPLAGHVTGRFRAAPRKGFDVNPVTWYVLAHHGVALRGPDRDRLEVWTDEAELRAWALANLNGYWRRWGARASRRPEHQGRPATALGGVGRARSAAMHYTVATGEIATKEAAARYALEMFEPRWHGLIEDAVAYWRGEPPSARYRRRPAGCRGRRRIRRLRHRRRQPTLWLRS